MCICMAPVASGTNALNLLYPRFMRSLILFQDIAFICLPYHHYFSSDWCSHEISLPFLAGSPSPLAFTLTTSHDLFSWTLVVSSGIIMPIFWSSVICDWTYWVIDFTMRHFGKKKRNEVRKWQPERVGERGGIYHTIINLFFFSLVVTCHFSASHPRPQHITPMVHFRTVEFDFGCSHSSEFLPLFPFALVHMGGCCFSPPQYEMRYILNIHFKGRQTLHRKNKWEEKKFGGLFTVHNWLQEGKSMLAEKWEVQAHMRELAGTDIGMSQFQMKI